MKFYEQSTSYSCGAACMRMVLEELGIKRSEEALMKIMGSSPKSGTDNNQLPKLAEHFRLSYVVSRNAKVEDITALQKQGYHIIVGMTDPIDNIGHFTIVKKVTAKEIEFIDPGHGPSHKLQLSVFKKNWKSMFEPDVGLLIGIRK